MSKGISTVLISALIAAHIFLGYGAINAQSPTYDEPVHFAAGWSYLKANDYRLNSQDHPPFAKMWSALPLMFLRPAPSLPIQHPYWSNVRAQQYPFSDLFLYHNRIDPEKMLNLGRMMTLLLSAALGFMIFIAAKEMFGALSGLFALALWCFLPAALASGTLVTTDTALALFYFTTVYLFRRIHMENEAGKKAGWGKVALLGASMGLLFASKYSALGILPVMAGLLLYFYLEKSRSAADTARDLAVGAAIAVAVLLFVYRFNDLGDYFLFGLKKVVTGISSGRSSFLLGQHSTTGWIYYFPVTFALKTPLPFLALMAAAAFFKRSWSREALLYLIVPAAAFFAFSCVSKVQIGHRHILPVYPFLIVWVSAAVSYVSRDYLKYVLAGFVALSAVSGARAYPWFISYFNAFVPSPDGGYRYLTDSNLDWGQGLKELGLYLKKENVEGIYLCYFGTGDPAYYGIKYVPIGFIDGISRPYTKNERTGDNIDISRFKRRLFAVSATNLQATYYADKKVFSFLKGVKPLKVVAHSIFIFDLDSEPGLYGKFMEFITRK